MKIVLDAEKCVGHGRCYSLAPEFFDADERGQCVVINQHVAPDAVGRAREGVANCPERALTLEDES
jgi:ferredoxin